jgi:hypothetical protein
MTASSSVPCNGTSTSAVIRNRREKEALTHRSKPSTSFPLVPARIRLLTQHTPFPHGIKAITALCKLRSVPGPIRAFALDHQQYVQGGRLVWLNFKLSQVRTRRPSCLVKLQIITSESIGHAASFSDAFPYRLEGMNERVSCTFWARPGPFVCPRPPGCFS